MSLHAYRAVHPQTYRAPPSPRHGADGWLFRTSVVYCSLRRVASLHVWSCAICRLHIKKEKKQILCCLHHMQLPGLL